MSGHCQEQLAQTLIFRDKDWKGGGGTSFKINYVYVNQNFTSYWKVFCVLPGDLDVFGWRSRWVALVQMMGPKKGWCAVETNWRVRNLISTSSIPTAFEVIWILREKRLETVSWDLSSSFGGHNKALRRKGLLSMRSLSYSWWYIKYQWARAALLTAFFSESVCQLGYLFRSWWQMVQSSQRRL